ncbi:MAG: hypothetical protein CSA21_03665 [Deltaproteobacteria bacterium]|nr:MAG: hypothetical protein CSA21_03665 [Deltaproteobacteria bacterium]
MGTLCRHPSVVKLISILSRVMLTAVFFVLACTSPCMGDPFQSLAPGLALGVFHLSPKGDSGDRSPTISLLRIDPRHFRFKLITQNVSPPKVATLKQWCKTNNLVAAINASMYRENRQQSTGYMKTHGLVNNGYINPRFGAFFVFDPQKPFLPSVQFLDRTRDDWRTLITKYDTVIQNFRLINAAGKNLWPRTSKKHSIAAVGMDMEGRVLFIHCQTPMSVHAFNQALLGLPVGIENAMYVEGGAEAAMCLHLGTTWRLWTGRSEHPFLGTTPKRLWPVPNVIGIQPVKKTIRPLPHTTPGE